MTHDEFSKLVEAADADAFARHNLLDETCYVFEDINISARGTYREFRRAIADHLDINPRNVAVIGSAKFGWSMSPQKFGTAYTHGASDIDIVIVSHAFFESSWAQIREAYFKGYDSLRSSHRNEIFAKFVVIKSSVNYDSKYLRDLRIQLLALNKIVRDFLSIEDKASYRIYDDWSDVELYHAKGVKLLQEGIFHANA